MHPKLWHALQYAPKLVGFRMSSLYSSAGPTRRKIVVTVELAMVQAGRIIYFWYDEE